MNEQTQSKPQLNKLVKSVTKHNLIEIERNRAETAYLFDRDEFKGL